MRTKDEVTAPTAFDHVAFWDADRERIEMRLRSTRPESSMWPT
jgi:uncharacterized SAM-dependent methyltransferase